ncbi:MAG: sigma-70 family RNA polymerase sigma factor [Lentisphaeraceae bacterium]|nr:sigma-70 family RNA polymerase sigma factor [Lentisphaeraceae bacterium]
MNTIHLKSLIDEIRQSDEKTQAKQQLMEISTEVNEQGENSDKLQRQQIYLQDKIKKLEDEERRRSEQSLQEIFVQYYPYIRSCLQKRSCPYDIIDDLTQDAAVRIQRSLRSNKFREVSVKGFLAWVRTIVHHTWADHWEKQRRLQRIREAEFQRFVDYDPGVVKQGSFVDHELVNLIFPRAVRKVFEEVTSLTYRSVCMRIIEGKSPAEVAAELGISSDVVDKQKSRFKTKLVRCVESIYREMNERLADTIPEASVFRKMLGKMLDELFLNDQLEALTVNVSPQLSSRLQWVQTKLKGNPLPEKGCWLGVYFEDKSEEFELKENIGIGSRSGFREGERIVLDYGDGAGLSGLHAMFEKEDKFWVLTDQHSTNGIRVNKEEVTRTYLKDKDVIQMGLVTMIFSCGEDE